MNLRGFEYPIYPRYKKMQPSKDIFTCCYPKLYLTEEVNPN